MKKRRKSPIRHKVHTHTREGKLIQSFERGKGNKPQKSGRNIAVGKNLSTKSPETTYPPITCPECGHVFPGPRKGYFFRVTFCPQCGKMISLKSIGLPEEAEYDMWRAYRKTLKPFFDRELRTAESFDECGRDIGGYVESVTTGKRYSWGDNWTTGLTLSATRMAKHLYKAGLLPDVPIGDPKSHDRIKRGTAKDSVLKWIKDKHDMG